MSAQSKLQSWLANQSAWVRTLAAGISNDGGLTDELLERAVQAVRTNKAPTQIADSNSGPSGAPLELCLLSIGPIKNIDAMAPREVLPLAPKGLTTVFGTNGSGKSGYTRIIRRASGAEGAPVLKGNVFLSDQNDGSCTFSYRLNATEHTVEWRRNDPPIAALAAIDVFDATVVSRYLKAKTTASYAPREIALLEAIATACKPLRELIQAEANALVSAMPAIPSTVVDTDMAQSLKLLSAKTRPAEVSAMATFTSEDSVELEAITERLATKDPEKLADQFDAQARQLKALGKSLLQSADAISDTALEAWYTAKAAAVSNRNAAEDAAAILGNTAEIDGVGTKSWKQLWEAARQYSQAEAYPGEPFPHVNDARCVLCHQTLESIAQQRMREFESFVRGQVEQVAKKSEQAFEKLKASLPAVPELDSLRDGAQGAALPATLTSELIDSWRYIGEVVRALKADAQIPNRYPVNMCLENLRIHYSALAARADQLRADAKDFDRKNATTKKRNLEAKKWASENQKSIELEVERLRKIDQLNNLARTVRSNQISSFAGRMSAEFLTEEYIERFNKELAALGAGHLRVELVSAGTKAGSPLHQVKLKSAVDPTASPLLILSDGERRILSLAAFLADVLGNRSNAPFVFDDPISSLDHQFERHVAKRLTELAEQRQVLVFTHRVSLLSILSGPTTGSQIEIRREPWGSGEPGPVSIANRKPISALNKLKNEQLPKARKALHAQGLEAYHPMARSICIEFRILLERFIELDLLGDVVQRHRLEVHTKNKIGKLARIEAKDCMLLEQLMTKYSIYAHTQSQELPVQMPEPDQLASDLQSVASWHKEFSSRPLPNA